MFVDVHGLAYSSMDNTPAIPHMVLSSADATALNNYYETSGNKIPYLQSSDFRATKVKNVPLPEDNRSCQLWSVEVALLKQCVNISSVNAMNGRNAVPLEDLLE